MFGSILVLLPGGSLKKTQNSRKKVVFKGDWIGQNSNSSIFAVSQAFSMLLDVLEMAPRVLFIFFSLTVALHDQNWLTIAQQVRLTMAWQCNSFNQIGLNTLSLLFFKLDQLLRNVLFLCESSLLSVFHSPPCDTVQSIIMMHEQCVTTSDFSFFTSFSSSSSLA